MVKWSSRESFVVGKKRQNGAPAAAAESDRCNRYSTDVISGW